MKSLFKSIALSSILALAAGCATTGYERASTTSSSLQDAAYSIDDALASIDEVLVALDDLANTPDVNILSQFETYSDAVSQFETSVDRVKNHSEQMQAQGDAYFQNWEEELAGIQSREIQARSRDRQRTMASDFRETSDRYVETKNDLEPFVSNLVDLRTALSTDLTPAGLDSLEGQLEAAHRDAASLRESLVQLSDEFREMGIALSPTLPSA